MQTVMLHVRLDKNTKAEAAQTLATMGLSLSDAVRMFLVRVAADKQLPFTPKAPNAQTLAAMAEAEDMVRSGQGRFATAAEAFHALEKTDG